MAQLFTGFMDVKLNRSLRAFQGVGDFLDRHLLHFEKHDCYSLSLGKLCNGCVNFGSKFVRLGRGSWRCRRLRGYNQRIVGYFV